MISELWSTEELWVGLVVISVWFFSEVLVCCSSLTTFLFIAKLSSLLVLLRPDAKKPQKFSHVLTWFFLFYFLVFFFELLICIWTLTFCLNGETSFQTQAVLSIRTLSFQTEAVLSVRTLSFQTQAVLSIRTL